MDSCLMTGVDGEVGSACGLTTSKNPINVARAIKEKTKHVMFAKPGNDLLKEWGIELCDSDYSSLRTSGILARGAIQRR